MSGCKDPLSGVPKQSVGDVPRICAAYGFALLFGDCDDLDGVRPRLVEDRSNKVDREIYRSEIVAVKDELKVIGFGVNIIHRNNSQKTNLLSKLDRLEQIMNYESCHAFSRGSCGEGRRPSGRSHNCIWLAEDSGCDRDKTEPTKRRTRACGIGASSQPIAARS
jgi:hypothetical protein